MKMKPKSLAAAIALALVASGQASAALIDNLNTGADGSSLIFTAWDPSRNVGYVQELSVNGVTQTLNSFFGLVGASTNSTTTAANASVSFTLDPLFSSTFTGSNANDIRWNVSANDSTGTSSTANAQRVLSTVAESANPTTFSFTNSGLNNTSGKFSTFFSSANTNCPDGSSCQVTNTTFAVYPGNATSWNQNFGAAATWNNAGAGLSDETYFMYVTGGGGTVASQAARSLFGNGGVNGEFAISGNNLTFSVAAVPVPAAVWLFGSGLLGLAGVARRRRS